MIAGGADDAAAQAGDDEAEWEDIWSP